MLTTTTTSIELNGFPFQFFSFYPAISRRYIQFWFQSKHIAYIWKWISSIYEFIQMALSLCVCGFKNRRFYQFFFVNRDQFCHWQSRQIDKSETQKIDKNNNGNQTVGCQKEKQEKSLQ